MHHWSRIAIVFLCIVAGRADVRTQDDIDAVVAAQMERLHIPGAAVAILRDGVVIKTEGYGIANLEHGVRVRPDTVFKIGSASKQFIAAGVMLLVQDGKLSVADKVSAHLPGTPATWRDITVRHLLTHTAGLVREGPAFDPFTVQPDIAVIESSYPLPLEARPGERHIYSNLGYFLLAEIITRVSGTPWDRFLTERVFAPLGMRATRTTTASEIVPNRADGYTWSEAGFRHMDDWPALRASGAFLSTVLDLAKWEGALHTDRVLTRRTKEEMWRWSTLNDGSEFPYGYGWQLNDWPLDQPGRTGVPMIRHGGTIPGFRANYTRWPSFGLTVIVLTNLERAPIEGLTATLAVRMVPELRTAGSTPAAPSTSPSLTK